MYASANLPRRVSIAAACVALASMLACSDGTTPVNNDVLEDATGDTVINDTGVDMEEDVIIIHDTAIDTTDSVEPDTTSPVVTELIVQGKQRLSFGESLSAMDSFDMALAIEPENRQAMWGMALARLQTNVSMFSSLPGLANYKDPPEGEEVTGLTTTLRSLTWPDHENTLGATIDGMYHGAIDQQARLDVLKAAPDTSFNLPDGLPLAFGNLPMMTLCCDWDASDAYAISSFNNLLLAFVSLLGSQQTDTNLAILEDVYKESPGIGNMITSTLELSEELFSLLPEHGEAIWTSMNDYMLAATADALESARLMGVGNDLAQNVATLSDDEKPYLVLHGTFPDGSESMEILWEGVNVSLKDVVDKANANLSGTPDSLLSLDADALIAVGVLVDIVNRTVGIEPLVSAFGFELPEIVTGLIGSLDKSDPEQLVGLLGSLTTLLGIQPGTIFLDLHGFLSNAYNIRDLFPNYGPEPGSDLKTFTRSFECVKGGTLIYAIDSGDVLQIYIQDPSITGEDASVVVRSYASADMTGDVSDQESVDMDVVAGFTGLFTVVVPLEMDAAATIDDMEFAVPSGGSIAIEYVSAENAENTFTFGGALADGVYPWDYGAACSEDASAWDAARFGETEFAEAIEIPSPGQTTALAAIPADGDATRTAFMAFKSPSFNHLLWIKDGETTTEATQATFSAIFADVMAALEDF